MNRQNQNPWTTDDEREHFPSGREWWCSEAFFTTIEDGRKWSFKNGFTQWVDKPNIVGSNYSQTLFDLNKNTFFRHYSSNKSRKLITSSDSFNIQFQNSVLKGGYPHYDMYLVDDTNDIVLELKYNAESIPRWVAQNITDGRMPMGFGDFRYGFIPRLKLSGIMKKGNKEYTIDGNGYFEHVWGDFSFVNPFSNVKGLKGTFQTYAKLISWWKQHHTIKIPKNISFSSENNPFGYDWIWAYFDNGWSIFFGNIRFWIYEGPAMGTLIITKNGMDYTEFCNIRFRYHKVEYSKMYDFYYPTDLELIAKKDHQQIRLRCKSISTTMEGVTKSPSGRYWLGFVITEVPCVIDGFYSDQGRKTMLNGSAKLESHRLVSIFGHNLLKLEFLLPPNGFGISSQFVSHYFKKNVRLNIQLIPRPHLKFGFNKIRKKIVKDKEQ